MWRMELVLSNYTPWYIIIAYHCSTHRVSSRSFAFTGCHVVELELGTLKNGTPILCRLPLIRLSLDTFARRRSTQHRLSGRSRASLLKPSLASDPKVVIYARHLGMQNMIGTISGTFTNQWYFQMEFYCSAGRSNCT